MTSTRRGTSTAAIHKAMGETELVNLGVPDGYREDLWKPELENGIDISDGIRGIALSWNCVAPAGENYFEADALRGPPWSSSRSPRRGRTGTAR